ncbi:AEC family transporter [uncultured Jannaschia sp.]|uniref:AEC family transporter n=1 Tax=uncultured Jannaschia sp. TaxID=293347 RepID=UPI00260A8242|nr:AEC family transporter [uncultured Jannaschia sp.]
MLDVLAVTVPVFLIIGAGYLSVWRKVFKQGHVDGLMVFTQHFAIPCLLFLAMVDLDLAEVFDWRLLVAYYSGSLVSFAAGVLGTVFWLKRGGEDAVAVGFAAMFANTVLLGLPIAERAFGTESLGSIYAIIALHAAFCYFVGVTGMELAQGGGQGPLGAARAVGWSMTHNPLMLGIALGLLVNLTGLPIPDPALEAVRLVARAALPAALFGLGGVLVQYRPEGDARGILLVCGIALILHPVWTYGAGRALGLETEQFRAAVITAAMAPGVNSYLFAAMHGRAIRIAASSVLLATAVSVLTVSAWLLVL